MRNRAWLPKVGLLNGILASLLFIAVLGLLVAHVFQLGDVQVDETALILIGILLFIPLLDVVRRIKIGNFFEAEISGREVQELRSNFVSDSEEDATQDVSPDPAHSEIADILQQDLPLGFAKLRIEIERLIRAMHDRLEPGASQSRRLGLIQMIRRLDNENVIPFQLSQSLNDIIGLANRAIHGESVRRRDAEELGRLGIMLLDELRIIHRETTIDPMSTDLITHDELEQFMDSKYRVTTVIPSVDQPSMNVRILDQEGFDDLLGGYDEYAEFIVGVERINED